MSNLEKERIKFLEQQIRDREHWIDELLRSKSWKLTRPLRWFHLYLSRWRSASQAALHGMHNGRADSPQRRFVSEKSSSILESASEAKRVYAAMATAALKAFLSSEAKLFLPSAEKPDISVILVLYNKAEFTLGCLSSLAKISSDPAEFILVDNGSQDETGTLLERIQGVKTIRNRENRNFAAAANQAAREAQGEYLLFLNNDAQVLPGSIHSALKTILSSENVGAVGAKLILPDGRLQEAGSILWRDGSCTAYGRGEDPFASEYMFRRDVDFCSAAFLMTKRELFLKLGGFDEIYRPAYYEDADYCLGLWKKDWRVVYDPNAALIHYEFGSSRSSEDAIRIQISNKKIFADRHEDTLTKQPESFRNAALSARTRRKFWKKILFIDDRVPHPSRGAGFPRSHAILTGLHALDCFISFYPMSFLNEDWDSVYTDIPRDVEVMMEHGRSRLEEFLEKRKNYYDLLVVSRPPNMEIVQSLRKKRPDLFHNLRIIYDAEAFFSVREVTMQRLQGKIVPEAEIENMIRNETQLANDVEMVLSVSEPERKIWSEKTRCDVRTLGYCVDPMVSNRTFEARSGYLFIGTIQDDLSPNADSVLWFTREVLPRIRGTSGQEAVLTIAGMNYSEKVRASADRNIRMLGYMEDLQDTYDSARVFVAPARFAAGIPIKVYEAAAHGIPVVATDLLGNQLAWKAETEILLANDAETFARQCLRLYSDSSLWHRIRENALQRVRLDCSRSSFQNKLYEILSRLR